MSTTKKNNLARRKILMAERRRKRIMSDLLKVDTMLRGSFAVVYTKCGKENCQCKNGKGHPHPRISWTEKGQGMTKSVPHDLVSWIQKVTSNYRRFRMLRRELVQVESENRNLMDLHESEVIELTKNAKGFWVPTPANRRKTTGKASKEQLNKKSRPS